MMNVFETGADPINQIIASKKTPLLLFDRVLFRMRFAHFRQYGQVYFPVKSNDHPDILQELIYLDSCFEVDSINHINRLLSMGVHPRKILFSIPIKKEDDISHALDKGITQYVIDSHEEYVKIAFKRQRVDSLRFIVRISVADILNLEDVSSKKWGTSIAEALLLADTIENDGYDFQGISFYLPQEYYNSDNFASVLNTLAESFRGTRLSVLDIGGGLDDSSTPGFARVLQNAKQELGFEAIYLEPGRNLLDPCINMVASVIEVRKRGEDMWAYIDAGVYSGLLDTIIKGKRFEIASFPIKNSQPQANFHYKLSGPTSDNLDFLGSYSFESQLERGDKLIIRNCGAYTYVLTTHFAGFETLTLEVF